MKIPRKAKDILVKNYLKYVDYIKTEPTDEKEIVKTAIMLFFDMDEDRFNTFEYKTILDMYKIIQNIMKVDVDLVDFIEIDGKEYGINPDFDDMTFGEMVDCDTDDVLRQIAILYRPIIKKKGKKYKIEKYKADISIYDKLKEELTLDVYLGFIGFFLKINKDILSFTQNSLMEMDIPVEKKKHLEQLGDGWLGYMTSVMRI